MASDDPIIKAILKAIPGAKVCHVGPQPFGGFGAAAQLARQRKPIGKKKAKVKRGK